MWFIEVVNKNSVVLFINQYLVILSKDFKAASALSEIVGPFVETRKFNGKPPA